ncbi:MAG: type II secretion system major pseudopilin GspG [Rhodanobacteraceae bacterium]|nr:type II secretion system major pseudopilin GspG [Rhodanobacteraceae bacterium]MBP9155094.1 type II secretion system major pseudopilin GspG [Xanthomonadales bacterium]
MQLRSSRGFTLIEVLVVVVILAILAAIVVPRVIGRTDDAMIAKAKADVQGLGTALNLYKLDNFTYPSTDQGLDALVQKPSGSPEAANWRSGGYIDRLPKDPWSRDYQYVSPGSHGDFDVYSLGKDGQSGGDGLASDIGNWSD